jgi:hypothetical protein
VAADAGNMSKESAAELVKNVLQGQGFVGNGTFDKDDPTALIDTFNYKASFDFKNFTQLPGSTIRRPSLRLSVPTPRHWKSTSLRFPRR